MKQYLLAISFSLGSLIFANAQDGIAIKVLRIDGVETNDETDYSSGTSIYELNSVNANDNVIELEFVNTTGNDVSWQIKRFKNEDVPADWSNMVCIGNSCFINSPLNPYCTPASIPMEIPNNSVAEGSFHIVPETTGTGTYTLYVGPTCDESLDSITIRLNYNNIQSLFSSPDNQTIRIFPNPSSELITIQTVNNYNSLIINNINGCVVLESEFHQKSTIVVSDFEKGVYFITLKDANNQTITQKIVIL